MEPTVILLVTWFSTWGLSSHEVVFAHLDACQAAAQALQGEQTRLAERAEAIERGPTEAVLDAQGNVTAYVSPPLAGTAPRPFVSAVCVANW